MTLEHADLKRIKQRFWIAVSPRHSLGVPIDVYLVPSKRDITTRVSKTHDGRVQRALPEEARFIGTYQCGCPASYLIEDLATITGGANA